MPALGIYPTVESLVAQGTLAVLLLAALVWTFLIEPRRKGNPERCDLSEDQSDGGAEVRRS